MKRRDQAPNLCDHFTGFYAGSCRAGVAYDEVKDQDRRGQMARFPCDRSLNSFTTCALARFTPPAMPRRRRIDLSEKNKGREVIYECETFGGREKIRGTLVGWSDDGQTVYLGVAARGKRRRMVEAPAGDCHLARARRGAEQLGARGGGEAELPLFDAQAAQAAAEPARITARGRGKADEARPRRKAA